MKIRQRTAHAPGRGRKMRQLRDLPGLQELRVTRKGDLDTGVRPQKDAILRARRLDRGDPVEAMRNSRDTLDVRDEDPALFIRIQGCPYATLSQPIAPARGRKAHVEVACHVLDTHDVDMASVPWRIIPSPIGEPQQRAGQPPRIAKGKPDVPLLRECDRVPGKL